MEIEAVGKLLGSIVAVGGSAWAVIKSVKFLYTKAFNPMFGIFQSNYRNLKALPRLVEDVAQMKETMRKEFSPNGGSSIRDILDRLESNQVIMAAQQDVQLQTQKLAVIHMDISGDVIKVSEPLCSLLGRSREDLLGRNWIDSICPEQREEVQLGWETAVEDHRNFTAHFDCCADDGDRVKVMMKVSPLHGGKRLGFMGTITGA